MAAGLNKASDSFIMARPLAVDEHSDADAWRASWGWVPPGAPSPRQAPPCSRTGLHTVRARSRGIASSTSYEPDWLGPGAHRALCPGHAQEHLAYFTMGHSPAVTAHRRSGAGMRGGESGGLINQHLLILKGKRSLFSWETKILEKGQISVIILIFKKQNTFEFNYYSITHSGRV